MCVHVCQYIKMTVFNDSEYLDKRKESMEKHK